MLAELSPSAVLPPAGDRGDADQRDLALAVCDAEGRLRLADRAGLRLPLRPDAAARPGERSYRPDGQGEGGSGLGVSIAQHVAALRGLSLRYACAADGRRVVASLAPVAEGA